MNVIGQDVAAAAAAVAFALLTAWFALWAVDDWVEKRRNGSVVNLAIAILCLAAVAKAATVALN